MLGIPRALARSNFTLGLLLVWLSIPRLGQGQEIKTLDHVTLMGGRVYVVTNSHRMLLKAELTLSPNLKIMTNGVVVMSGIGQTRLSEGRKITFDGLWLNSDGMLVVLRPHYMVKDRGLYLVTDGLFQKQTQDVLLKNGAQLTLDGTLLTRDQKLIRLQDGHMLTPDGEGLLALDHVMLINGRLVLQKDGSIIDLPPGRVIGMSDSSKVEGGGTVTSPDGHQIVLREGQRLTLAGAAMPQAN